MKGNVMSVFDMRKVKDVGDMLLEHDNKLDENCRYEEYIYISDMMMDYFLLKDVDTETANILETFKHKIITVGHSNEDEICRVVIVSMFKAKSQNKIEVGYKIKDCETKDGIRHIKDAELIEVSKVDSGEK